MYVDTILNSVVYLATLQVVDSNIGCFAIG